jgi:hypothetical protein
MEYICSENEKDVSRLIGQSVLVVRIIHNNREGPLAQRLVQRTHNPLVDGSNPSGPTNFFSPLAVSLALPRAH